jgi:hypothetical protein
MLGLNALRNLVAEMSTETNQMSAKLIRQLKQKDKLVSKLNKSCDILTALLQARSLKRSKFSYQDEYDTNLIYIKL